MKELCDCGKVAIWLYLPSSSDESNPFFCDDCVPRGCTCNHRYVDVNAYLPPLDNSEVPTDEDQPIKWLEERKIWCHVDEKGREYPCCEFMYEEDGFEIEEETIFCPKCGLEMIKDMFNHYACWNANCFKNI